MGEREAGGASGFHVGYCRHTVTVYNRATLNEGLYMYIYIYIYIYIHIKNVTKLLLSGGGGSIQIQRVMPNCDVHLLLSWCPGAERLEPLSQNIIWSQGLQHKPNRRLSRYGRCREALDIPLTLNRGMKRTLPASSSTTRIIITLRLGPQGLRFCMADSLQTAGTVYSKLSLAATRHTHSVALDLYRDTYSC